MYKHHVYSDELYHHGVKGMKWGVRRFQRPDGTLTRRGQKRYDKLQKSRTSLADQARKNSSDYKAMAKQSKQDLEDLRKNGQRSKLFKEHMDSEMNKATQKRDSRYATAKGYEDVGQKVDLYAKANKAYSDRTNYLTSANGRKTEFKNLMESKASEVDEYNDSAKSWARRNKKLMSMPISVTTKKSEIYKTYYFDFD